MTFCHFKKVINLDRTNNLRITHDDMIVGIIYEDEEFYFDLIHAIGEVAVEADFTKELESVIHALGVCPRTRIVAKITETL